MPKPTDPSIGEAVERVSTNLAGYLAIRSARDTLNKIVEGMAEAALVDAEPQWRAALFGIETAEQYLDTARRAARQALDTTP